MRGMRDCRIIAAGVLFNITIFKIFLKCEEFFCITRYYIVSHDLKSPLLLRVYVSK